jgi:hypothetical protein
MFDRRFVVLGIAILLIGSSFSFSQVPDISWSMSIPQINPNYPADMALAPNGDWVIAVNYKKGDDGFRDTQVVARFSADGDPIWVISPEVGEGQKNFTFDIAVADNGNTWVIGEMDIETGWPYPFVMVIDAGGTVLWSQLYSSQENAIFSRVLPLTGGSAIIAGSRLNDDDLRDAFATEIDASGDIVWIQNYGDLPEGVFKDVIEFDGGLLFSGGQNMTQLYYDPFFVHTDMSGNEIWSRTQNVDLFQVHGAIELDDGGFVTLNSVLGLMWLLWFDNTAELTGVRQLDIYRADRKFTSIPFDMMPDGGFAVGGVDNEGNALLLRTDASGARMWQNVYMNNDPSIEQEISTVMLMSNGAIQFCGVKIDNNDASWIVQLDPEGVRGSRGSRVMKPFMLPLDAEE